MTVAVRFAPSPTGHLHIGNIRTAIVNWLFAARHGGSFMFRLDDTDEERSTQAFADAIAEDLTWLGLTWDRYARESDRYARYADAAEALRTAGRLYPCYETPDELGLKRKAMLAQHRPPIYDRAALRLTDTDRARLEAEGRRPHWRFKLNHSDIVWDDLVQGHKHFRGADLSDPVLIREDGRPLYTLTSVVDDLDFAITHIVRGEDHVTNTAVQVQLFEALIGIMGQGIVPTFAHLPLIAGSEGEGLSKRLGSLSVRSLRQDEGVEPLALIAYLARLGTSDAITAAGSMAELAEGFDFGKFGRGTPKFDSDELMRLNTQVLHNAAFADVADRLTAMGMVGVEEAFWLAVRPNLTRLSDAKEWWAVTKQAVTPMVDDAAFLATAAGLLPAAPWDDTTWGVWTKAVSAATGAKGKALFLPLRRALTAHDHGPELKTLLPLIGRERALARLSGCTA
ncbi:glutamate--tRNA ligase [Niveispirillum lacus]|uniref:Glutamate--tRNA ligase n=1 Tax=Niveispirillum lacus TaxID=1981099 RepID=A0A255YUJ2_9PROT|nr:glutamate--tRNA ligase [Niveispirillum lacus]OYQ32878.1 glutamate--tRNA ligase [Niveispirillum lacus]